MYKYLVWSGTAALIVLSMFLLVFTKHISNTATTTNTVSFSGEGRITAQPDVAKATISMVTQATTSNEAQDDNSRRSQAVVEFLKNQDIDEKDIRTSSYNISPQYHYPRLPSGGGGQPTITGYQVTQSIEVKIRNLDNASEILDGVVSAGANQVSSFSFEIDDPEKLKDDARQQAIEDAKAKADTLKKQLGIKLGRIINFSESTGGFPLIMHERALDAEIGIGGAGPDLPTGENEIIVHVTLTYQIK